MESYYPYVKPNYFTKKDETPVYIRYNYNRTKRTLLPVNISINPIHWDFKKRKLKLACPDFYKHEIEIRNKIDDILAEFGVLEKKNTEEEIKRLSEQFIILTSKGNFKKILTRWGVEPQRIVVAGVPLEAEDMRILNPKIPETALEPIKKKISHVKNDINRKMEQFDTQQILVVVENDKSGEILAKRAEDIYSAQVMAMDSLKDTSVLEFRKALER